VAAARERRFPAELIERLDEVKYLRIRAGGEHRFIGIWVVVVEGRAFVRSWTRKPRSWWRTFLEEPRGAIELDGREIAVRAVQTRSERLKDAVSKAYLAKYTTKANVPYAVGMDEKERRDTTTELVPLSLQARGGRPAARQRQRKKSGTSTPSVTR
jgi:hypothetical protein